MAEVSSAMHAEMLPRIYLTHTEDCKSGQCTAQKPAAGVRQHNICIATVDETKNQLTENKCVMVEGTAVDIID